MRFRKTTDGTGESGRPNRYRRLLLAGGMLGALVVIAGAAFAVRELATGDSGDDTSVQGTGGEAESSIGDVLAGTNSDGETVSAEPPDLTAADLEALGGGAAPPVEELAAEGREAEIERLDYSEQCGHLNTITIGGPWPPPEPPLCGGLPVHAGSIFRVCAQTPTLPIGFKPSFIHRYPGFPTTSTITIGGAGGSSGPRYGRQWVYVRPVAEWVDTSGQRQYSWGDWFASTAPFAIHEVSRDGWFTFRDGRWQSGFDVARSSIFGSGVTDPEPITAISNHPGLRSYRYWIYYYWAPIQDLSTGQQVFGGLGHWTDYGVESC